MHIIIKIYIIIIICDIIIIDGGNMNNKKIMAIGGALLAIIVITFVVIFNTNKVDKTEEYEKMYKLIDGIVGYKDISIDDFNTLDGEVKIKMVLDKIEYFDLTTFECDDEFCYLDEELLRKEYLNLFGINLAFDLNTIEGITSGCSSNKWVYDSENEVLKRNATFVDACDPFGHSYFILDRSGREKGPISEITSKIAYQMTRYNAGDTTFTCHLYKDSKFIEVFATLDYPCDAEDKQEEVLALLNSNKNLLYSRVHQFEEKDGIITIKSYSIK
jgi:hypothetical protein